MDVQRLIETSSQAAAGWPPPPCPLLREEGSRGWFPSWFRPSAHRFPMNAGGESRLVPSWFRGGPGGGHHPLTPSSERRGVAAGSPPGSGGGQGVVGAMQQKVRPCQRVAACTIFTCRSQLACPESSPQ